MAYSLALGCETGYVALFARIARVSDKPLRHALLAFNQLFVSV
jgi:hypothetical protein